MDTSFAARARGCARYCEAQKAEVGAPEARFKGGGGRATRVPNHSEIKPVDDANTGGKSERRDALVKRVSSARGRP